MISRLSAAKGVAFLIGDVFKQHYDDSCVGIPIELGKA
jgi:hypothetical protein